MSQTELQRLLELEQQLQSNLVSPRADTASFLNQALEDLRAIPFSIAPARRVNCLLSIAQQFCHQGQSVFSGVEPAALAVMVVSDLGDASLQRKALTFQGIILSQTNNPGDALLSLADALRLAEGLNDAVAVAAVWNSLGGAFYEAALYLDALECYERASAVAAEIRDLANVRAWATANAALCCLHTHQHQKGIEKIRTAIAQMAVTQLSGRTPCARSGGRNIHSPAAAYGFHSRSREPRGFGQRICRKCKIGSSRHFRCVLGGIG